MQGSQSRRLILINFVLVRLGFRSNQFESNYLRDKQGISFDIARGQGDIIMIALG